MRIDCALLCDAATVREGLLHVLGGGVTRINRPGFPTPLSPLSLAMRVLVHPTEADRMHKMQVRLLDEDGAEIARFDLEFGVGDTGQLEAGEEVSLPLPLTIPPNVGLEKAGRYSFEILIDGNHQASIPFIAKHTPPGEG